MSSLRNVCFSDIKQSHDAHLSTESHFDEGLKGSIHWKMAKYSNFGEGYFIRSDFHYFVFYRLHNTSLMKNKGTHLVHALAVHCRALVWRIGLLNSRGWAQHIFDRWHGAVSNRSTAYH